MNIFAKYTGGLITEEQWSNTAQNLGCESEVLKAFAEVESGGHLSFWRLNKVDGANIPAILYERHYFSRLTKNSYDQMHPDISWPTGYVRLDKRHKLSDKNKHMPDGTIESSDTYSDYASAYLRLINAYSLDPDAALRSCSWGKFQVMGDNYALCGADSVNDFVEKICTSEAAQISLMANYILKKPQAWKNRKNKKLGKEISLHEAIKVKNWAAIAFNYNGPGYRTYSYDTKLEAAYDQYKKKST